MQNKETKLMDELANRLREDADQIQVSVSPELDARIRASLESARADAAVPKRSQRPSGRFWIASTLTGAALAAVFVVAVNLRPPATVEAPPASTELAAIELPDLPWRVQPAVLTSPLEEEYERLQDDIRKVEKAVREELEAAF